MYLIYSKRRNNDRININVSMYNEQLIPERDCVRKKERKKKKTNLDIQHFVANRST